MWHRGTSVGCQARWVEENGMGQADKAGHGWILLGCVRNLHSYLQNTGKLSWALNGEAI